MKIILFISNWRKLSRDNWQRDYFHSLIIRQKCHARHRSLQVGDIVLVQYTNLIRGNWRLAQVKEAVPGKDGLVRDVMFRVKNQDDAKPYDGLPDTYLTRSIHRLVLTLPVEEQKLG